MGRSLSTKIVYGYDIGSQNGDDGWKFEEYDASEYRIKWPEWVQLDDEDSDGEPEDFITQAEERLITKLTGFTESDYDWRDPDPKVQQDYITFEVYGVGDYVEWVMGFEMGKECDGIGELDPEFIATLLNPLNMADMDYRLRDAIRVLELHPKGQLAPRLLLLASYF